MTKKILCICAQGMNRSKYAANYFANLGYETRYKGAWDTPNRIAQEDWDWADCIVFAVEPHQKTVHELFGRKEEEYVLNVSDDPKYIPELWVRVKLQDPEKFYREFTFPRMLEALKNVQQKL